MSQQDKELLLRDLSARLMYNVMLHIKYYDLQGSGELDERDVELTYGNICYCIQRSHWVDFKPYLRPLSSMTEEEHNEWYNYYHGIELKEAISSGDYLKAAILGEVASIEWLHAYHFDCYNLIEKGLAIEVTKENNPYKRLYNKILSIE